MVKGLELFWAFGGCWTVTLKIVLVQVQLPKVQLGPQGLARGEWLRTREATVLLLLPGQILGFEAGAVGLYKP